MRTGFRACHEGQWIEHGDNTWLAIMSKQAMMMASLGDRLGLDPGSRAALKLPDARQQKAQFAGLIGQSGSSNSSSVLPSLAA